MEILERLTVEYAGKLWHFELAMTELNADSMALNAYGAMRYVGFSLAHPFDPNQRGEVIEMHEFTKPVTRGSVVITARDRARAWLKQQQETETQKLAAWNRGDFKKGIVL